MFSSLSHVNKHGIPQPCNANDAQNSHHNHPTVVRHKLIHCHATRRGWYNFMVRCTMCWTLIGANLFATIVRSVVFNPKSNGSDATRFAAFGNFNRLSLWVGESGSFQTGSGILVKKNGRVKLRGIAHCGSSVIRLEVGVSQFSCRYTLGKDKSGVGASRHCKMVGRREDWVLDVGVGGRFLALGSNRRLLLLGWFSTALVVVDPSGDDKMFANNSVFEGNRGVVDVGKAGVQFKSVGYRS